MSYLLIDDLFLENRKIAALTDRQLRLHLGALLYASRNRTRGLLVPAVIKRLGASPRDVERFVVLHLWDPVDDEAVEEGSYTIHDFIVYNGVTIEERVHAYLERHPDAPANEVVRAVAGNRKLVLAVVKQLKDAA